MNRIDSPRDVELTQQLQRLTASSTALARDVLGQVDRLVETAIADAAAVAREARGLYARGRDRLLAALEQRPS